MDVTADWYWEGNVVEAIARFLAQDEWTNRTNCSELSVGRRALGEWYNSEDYKDARPRKCIVGRVGPCWSLELQRQPGDIR